jgi:hypothetical protein
MRKRKENPKSEYRNPKQAPMIRPRFARHVVVGSRQAKAGLGASQLEIRASDLFGSSIFGFQAGILCLHSSMPCLDFLSADWF